MRVTPGDHASFWTPPPTKPRPERVVEEAAPRPECRRACDRVDLCSCPSDLPLPYHEYLEKQNRRDRDQFEMRPTAEQAAPAREPVRPTEDPSYAGPRLGDVSESDPSPRHRAEFTARYEAFTPTGNVIDVFG
ncbi:MAG: hypothetical protein AAFX05_04705 [Planctomycetota bacterium]